MPKRNRPRGKELAHLKKRVMEGPARNIDVEARVRTGSPAGKAIARSPCLGGPEGSLEHLDRDRSSLVEAQVDPAKAALPNQALQLDVLKQGLGPWLWHGSVRLGGERPQA